MVLTQENKSFKLQMKFCFTVQDPLHASCLERLGESEAQTCSILKDFILKQPTKVYTCAQNIQTLLFPEQDPCEFFHIIALFCIVWYCTLERTLTFQALDRQAKQGPVPQPVYTADGC